MNLPNKLTAERQEKGTNHGAFSSILREFGLNHKPDHMIINYLLVLLLTVDQAVRTGLVDQARTAA
jgi:hypothetical protein